MSSRSIYPTPVCMDTLPPKSEEALRRESLSRPHRSRPSNLRDMVSQQDRWEELDREKYGMKDLFPTPIADDTGMRTKPYSQGGHALSLVVGQKEGLIDKVSQQDRYGMEELFSEEDRNQSSQQTSQNSQGGSADHTFPTPGTTGFSNGSGNCDKANRLAKEGVLSEEERVSFRAGNGGQLSPDWTEWLMGWPIGWTDLKPMNREDFEKWRLAVLDGTWWAIDPADLPKDHPGYLSRLTEDGTLRANRLKAIGNGQVPMCVLLAHILMMEENTDDKE